MNEPGFLLASRKRRPALRACGCEPLESRIALSAAAGLDDLFQPNLSYATLLELERLSGTQYSGGVSVSETKIFTADEIIPRFVAEPTITAVRSGAWNDPGMWSAPRVPTSGDRVAIGEGVSAVFSQVSDARLDGLEISGSLFFSTAVNTRMIVGNLTVMPTGRLQIGASAAPVNSGVTAELVIADRTLDAAVDPRQFGTGLIALGEVTIHGAAVSSTWLRLAAEPKAGDNSLLVSGDVSGWRSGDHLVLPDTRQVLTSQELAFENDVIAPEWEELIVDRVEGNRVYLSAPLAYDHLGARNTGGGLELLPHVALVDRNVIIRSENPQGTRGHTLFTARAEVDIRFAQFQDLGRTDALRPLDNTVLDADGNVTHLGTNQIGRYAVHLHHLMGPENPANEGYQFKFVGNTVERSLKWAVAVHDTSFGLVDRNVVYDAQGAGFVTEDGSEVENTFSNNIAVRIQGTHDDGKSGTQEGDYGRGGAGFWFRRGGNEITGNVAADATFAGFVFDGYFGGAITLPAFRGAEKHQPGQGVATELSPITWFSSNEAYGMSRHGLWAAYVAGNNLFDNHPLAYVQDLRLWHIFHSGVLAYHTNNMTFERLLILGDLESRDRNDSGPVGMHLATYENFNLVVRNSRMEGLHIGIVAPTNDATQAGVERPTVIRSSTLKNYINIVVTPPRDNRPSHGSVLEVRDVLFALVGQLPLGPAAPSTIPAPANIFMTTVGSNVQWTQPSIVRVYNYNRVAGDDFQVFYHEQAPSFVLPQTSLQALSGRDSLEVGSPAAGLTNAENWDLYGIAMGGMPAPAGASASRSEIGGLVAPIQDLSALMPTVILVTPWTGAAVPSGEPVRIRYNVVGLLPPGGHVYFRLDGAAPVGGFKDNVIFNLAPGVHQITAYIGDDNGDPLDGANVMTYIFTVVG